MKLALLAAALLAAACTQAEKADAPLPSLKGQAVSAISAKLGAAEPQPDGSLAWTMEMRPPATPVPSTRVSYAAGVPNTVETLSYPVPRPMETCTLRATADGAGRIASNDWDGSRAACYALWQKLTSP